MECFAWHTVGRSTLQYLICKMKTMSILRGSKLPNIIIITVKQCAKRQKSVSAQLSCTVIV